MITLHEAEYVVTVSGCEVARFPRFDDALTALLELVPVPLAS